jgi:Rod binding domain-containing protein
MDALPAIAVDPSVLRDVAKPRIPRAATPEEARRVGQEFEALFLGQMLAPLFAGLKSERPFGGGQGETMFRSLLTDEYGKHFTRAGGIGIADAVARQILTMQEQSHGHG